jgi:hypothetical protein
MSGQMLLPSLLALGCTYMYLGKDYGWVHEVSSLSMSCLHGIGKLVMPWNWMDDDLSNLFGKVCCLKKLCKVKIKILFVTWGQEII